MEILFPPLVGFWFVSPFSGSAPALSTAAGMFLLLRFPSFAPRIIKFPSAVLQDSWMNHGWTMDERQEGTERLKVAATCTTFTLLLSVLASAQCGTALYLTRRTLWSTTILTGLIGSFSLHGAVLFQISILLFFIYCSLYSYSYCDQCKTHSRHSNSSQHVTL